MKNAFNEGVWYAVEMLVLHFDEPSMADEIIRGAGITKKEAEEIMKETEVGVEKLKGSLKIFLNPNYSR